MLLEELDRPLPRGLGGFSVRAVTAFLQDGRVHLASATPVQIPVTGVLPTASDDRGESSGWTPIIGPEDDHVVLALA